MPLSEKFTGYANDILAKIRENNIRVEISDANETLSKRIREAEMKKIPYVLVVGEREEKSKTVSIRHYRRGQDGETSIEKLVEKIKKEIAEKVI